MKNRLKSKLFLIALCSFSCNITSAFTLPIIELTPAKKDAIFNVSIAAAFITYIAATQYAITTYLATEEFLVKTDYPVAQAWYDAMTIKYPTAHLDQKLFLQTMRHENKKYISWCSTFNQIYFPQDALQDIETLYQKQLDGEFLTHEEILTLGKQEFILLHEAGHIEHGDMTQRFMNIIGAFAITETARALYKENNPLHTFSWYDLYLELIAFTTLLNIPTRFQESAADAFAYSAGDMNALHGGISFFESEETDSLWDIENKKLSPFVKTDSIFGKLVQAFVAHKDEKELADKRWYKSNAILRWIYDYNHGATHPGASVRAQAIRDEIAHRLETATQTA